MPISKALRDAMRPPKALVIDIECSPSIVYSWGVHEQRISTDAVIEPGRVLCFAAKWLDQKRIHFYDERGDRAAMIQAAWDLLNDADIVIGWNSVAFDLKYLRAEFIQAGLGPPSPWLDVDLLKESRKNFRFLSHKLGFVLDTLCMETKLDSGGLSTWKKVMDGDEKAWAHMARYNKMDVQVTTDIFHVMKPWLRLPHAGLWLDDLTVCYSCGSADLVADGISRTKTTAYVRLYCDACGVWNRLLASGETRPA